MMSAIFVIIVLAIVIAWWMLHRRQLQRIAVLAGSLPEIVTTAAGQYEAGQPRATENSADFSLRLYRGENFLTDEAAHRLRTACLGAGDMERSYFPAHKAGGTVSYEALFHEAPEAVAFYHSELLKSTISNIVGEPVTQTPIHDQSSCSLLLYTKPGDHIGWHYDYNFYRGRHFTVLYVLENRGSGADHLSHCQLQVRRNGEISAVPTPPNSLIVFEGREVMHRVTRLQPDEYRVLLSMTFTTNPSNYLWQGVMRRCKDVAYYGVRALWS
ncbi:MAG: 2OG-Fe(II) oxygenase [Pseudomonadales bacterium]|nr:2OG-Fe(II) oxygenase [Pseudomonadales bacterium]